MRPKKKDLFLVGGGGHCRCAIEAIEAAGGFEIAGIIDVPEKVGLEVSGYKILGTFDDIPRLFKKTALFLITVGEVDVDPLRARLFEQVSALGFRAATVISPGAHVSTRATVGDGTIIMHGAFLNVGAVVGKNCILNTLSIVEHDSTLGDHTSMATGAIVNGGCQLGEGVFVGSQSVVRQYIRIADHTLIAAGSVVVKDIEKPGVRVIGVWNGR